MNARVSTDTGNAFKNQPQPIVPAQTNHKLIYVFLQLHPSRGEESANSQLTSAASLFADFGI